MKKFIHFIFYIIITYIILDVITATLIRTDVLHIPSASTTDSFHRQTVPYAQFAFRQIMTKSSFDKITFFKSDSNTLKVAFFGGSTGQPIDERYFSKVLSKYLDTDVEVVNFSCSAAHHRQHLHMIPELFGTPERQPDIVVFYGGYNELMNPLIYDPRPGYPYNFYYKEQPLYIQALIRYSATFYLLESRTRNITSYNRLADEYQVRSDEWTTNIINKYFETLTLANNFTNTLHSNRYGHTKFIAFYQPYREDLLQKDIQSPDNYLESITSRVKEKIKEYDYIYDVHDAYNDLPDSIWGDDCHVNDWSGANEHIVETMSKIIGEKFKQ